MFPFFVNAYGIENFYINATVLENGDILVEEYFNMNGDFNGMNRTIDYRDSGFDFDPSLEWYGPSNLSNGSGIDIIQVGAVAIDSNFDFDNIEGTIFSKVDYADVGDYGVFTEEATYDGTELLIYNPSSKNKAFYLKYRLKNMAVKFNDIGEIYWNIPINKLKESIHHLKITVKLNKRSNEFRVWAHGPLHGELWPYDNTFLVANIDNVSAGTPIDVRMVFDSSYLLSSEKIVNESILPKLLAYEEDKAAQANYKREQEYKRQLESFKYNFEECDEYPNYECYNSLSNQLSVYSWKEEDKNYYMALMPNMYERAVKNEEDAVIALVVDAEESLSYKQYKNAEEALINVLHDDLKEELKSRLFAVRTAIKEKEENINKILLMIDVILGGVLIAICFRYKYLNKNEYKKVFNHKYYRDIPDMSPTDVSYVMNELNISNDAISAEILMLICNKHISVERILGTKDDYKFIKNVTDVTALSKKEQDILDLLFKNKNERILSEFKKHAKKFPDTFYRKWKKIVNDAEKDGKKLEVFEKNAKIYKITEIFMLCFFIIACGGPFFFIVLPIVYIILLVGVIKAYKDSKLIRSANKKLMCFVIYNIFIVSLALLVGAIVYSHFVTYGITASIVLFVLAYCAVCAVLRYIPFTDKGLEK